MDRKKTVIAAAMINAGLLGVLFIAAMTREEDVSPAASLAEEKFPLPQYAPPEPVMYAEAMPLHKEALPASSFLLPPIEETAAIKAAEPALPPAPSQSSLVITVQKGDSLEKLAKRYHTTIDEIVKLNQLSTTLLKAGRQLKLPPSAGQEAEAPSHAPVSLAEQAEYYTMKVGDNPWSIAMKHHMKVGELLKLNGLNEKTARKLKPGDRLRIR